MKNFLRILIILLTILFFSLIVVSVKYASYKYSCFELETNISESIENDYDDILINVGKIKTIDVINNKLIYKLNNNTNASTKNKYTLVNVTCNINAICDFLDKDANNEAFENVYAQSKKDVSQIDGSTTVYNFDNLVGLKFTDGYLTKVEVYDKTYVFGSNLELSNFDEIVREFGMGTYIAFNEGTYTSYKMLYRYKNTLVIFTSFYEDGRCNVCEIENIIRKK